MREFYNKYQVGIKKLIFFMVFILFSYLFINKIFTYVAPFILGYILALILEPLTKLLNERFKTPRGAAALVCIALFILIVGILGGKLMVRLFSEIRSLYEALPYFLEEISTAVNSIKIKFNNVFELIPDELQTFADNVTKMIVSAFSGLLGSGVKTGSLNIVSFVPNFLLSMILMFISAFFFIKDKHIISKFFHAQLPDYMLKGYRTIRKSIFHALEGYIKAQLIIMTIVSIICLTGLSILRSPYSLAAGVIIALIDAVPVFGSGAVLWPWAVFSMIDGNYYQAIGLLIIYGVIFITRQILEPRLVGNQIGIHPLITLMSMYIGMRVFGVLGFLIGPVIVIITKALLETDSI